MKYFIILVLLLLLAGIILLIIAVKGARKLHISKVILRPSKTRDNDLSHFEKIKECYIPDIDIQSLQKDGKHRLIFFSDLHAEYCFLPVENFCKILDDICSRTSVDALVFGGDIQSNAEGYEKGKTYMNSLSEKCKSLNIPFIGVTGNHDTRISEEQVRACGFKVLSGDYIDMGDYLISGIDDSGRLNRIWYPNPLPHCDKRHILLSHNPDWILEAAGRKELESVDHMLSGHIHGGQIKLPFNLENLAIRKDLLPKRKVIEGVFDAGGVSFFISRGLGCVLLPLRLFSDPEISIVELE